MRAKAVFMGHPLHPMLVAFPIVFFLSGFVCDILGRALDSASWWAAGAAMIAAGIVAALAAGATGLVDYLFAVPPASSAKSRATEHMLANLGALSLFIIALLLRGGLSAPPGAIVLILEAAGVLLLGLGGWLGGTLVYSSQIGVEHMYAHAGSWKEQSVRDEPGKPLDVAQADELRVDQMKLLRINGRRIVLARREEGYVAFDDCCSHKGGSLADGVMMCGKVQCLWHGSQFNTATGAVESPPAKEPISTYKVQQSGDRIQLVL